MKTVELSLSVKRSAGGQIVEFPVGIILLMHPRIAEDGSIHLRVAPSISSLSGMGPENVPITSTRELETSVVVRPGDTILLSGLIREQAENVPALSQLPLAGEIFRSRSGNRRRTEIIISITPRLSP